MHIFPVIEPKVLDSSFSSNSFGQELLKYGPIRASLYRFLITIQLQLEKALMLCLEIEPGAAGW